jgi:hypothetical protein
VGISNCCRVLLLRKSISEKKNTQKAKGMPMQMMDSWLKNHENAERTATVIVEKIAARKT